MKKTFRKAIAVLLAVLMVAFSVPFSAFAADLNYGGDAPIGWWGDNNWKGWENANIPQGEQDYEGLNGDTYQFGLAWADAISIDTDLSMPELGAEMMENYKPVLTVTVSDQGTADNRIYREYYGYSTSYDYDTVKAAGNILNPADLKAGQRIAVTFEIGGFDMLYAGQLKGTIDTDKLAYAYYTLNPSSTDRWKQCSSTQTSQAFITRGYSFYGDAATDGGAQVTDNETGQFYCPFSCNTAVPSSAYCGKDLRPYGKDGMIICTLSLEVLQDCNLAEAIDFEKDNDNNPVYGITSFSCYDEEEIGLTRRRFTMDTTDNKYTCGLIAVNYNDYDASGSSECAHTNTEVQNAVAATCTTDGYSGDIVCLDCGETVTPGSTITATGHTEVSADNAVAATCTTDGKEADTVCSVCGETLTVGATIPATGHNYTSSVTTDATCTDAGVTTWTCVNCGDSYTTDEPAATGHTEVSADNAVAATCTTDGKEADTVCSVCGETLTVGATIPATGHTEVSANNAVAATCTTDGKEADTVCSVCGETLTVGATILASGHNYSMVKTDATCTAESTETYTCAVCGDTYTTHVDAALGHDFSVVVSSTAGDCQTVGTTTYKCSRCDATDTVDGAYGPHTPVSADNAVAETCTTDGKEADTVCSVCGTTITVGATIPATGHTEVSANNAVAATCTTDGKEADTVCSVCGETLTVGATIPATGHTEVSANNAVAATCTTDGKEADTVCSVCGETLTVGATIPALEGVNITVNATDLGTTAINGEDATNGATVKVLKNSTVTLTATPVEGAEFVGWALNGKIVSTDATFSPVALADATYTPVFTETSAATFTVVFVDNYGNVISTQQVTDASEIVAPTAPTRPGYTFKGWSVDYATLTEGATIYAQYEKDAAATYTVTATGCTITTAAGATAIDVMTGVAYDTKVTITANDDTAASWKVGESTVAFGESYTFYVGSDITVVPQFNAVVAVPTVTAVSVSEVTESNGLKRAVFLATRSMTDDCTLISAGYIYGKAANVTDATTIEDVNGSTVKRIDARATSEQFSVIYGLSAQTGSVAAKAYVAYVDAEGTTQVIYADLQTYTYA
ncbi:MAG: InlB B-repeat-containing protein [Eubacterium sp.]